MTKKLQIWRLPPVLIIHLKRFQNVNSRWIKSHKIVDFPLTGLDPTRYIMMILVLITIITMITIIIIIITIIITSYLAAVPAATLTRHKELQGAKVSVRSPGVIETIEEVKEDAVDLAELDLHLEDDPNDSGIESNGSQPTLERGVSGGSDIVFDPEQDVQVRILKLK